MAHEQRGRIGCGRQHECLVHAFTVPAARYAILRPAPKRRQHASRYSWRMVLDPDLATVAALIGEPTRASMLLGLMDGRAQTASELAAAAGVASSTASEHLGQL